MGRQMAQQTKKRSPRKKPAAKKRRQKKRSGFSWWKPLMSLLLLAAVGAGGYFYGYVKGRDEHLRALNAEKQHSFELENALKKAKAKTASHEYDKTPPKASRRVEPVVSQAAAHDKPMLAIIFDDVSFAHDVRNIKALGLPVTMSFLPPSKRHPNSAKLAAKEPFYMVHLPMEAMAFSGEEPGTLHVDDSAEVIDTKIREVKKLFPKVRFINNHTGSRFTSDSQAVERLIYALDREGITFIDSRTTAKTAVPALMKSLHRPYISRDVFLDHDPDVASVKKQVARAVRVAKKYGYAIAIGHPHKKTLQGVAESRALFNDVELVTVDTLVAHMKR